MQNELTTFLTRQARSTSGKYFLRAYCRIREQRQVSKRTGGKPKGFRILPSRWKLEQQFSPFYVRSRIACFAYSLARALQKGRYRPRPSLHQKIRKPGGGTRTISIFTVPDAAIANWLNERLLKTNGDRLSDYAFAYRRDKNINDALYHISAAIRDKPRVFVVEYDFARFFDSISHRYLFSLLRRYYAISPYELVAIRNILSGPYAEGVSEYSQGRFHRRKRGIPQGSSLSLFLANAACHELDKELEGLPVVFARYADDLVVATDNYSDACRAAAAILEWAKRADIAINEGKSDGVTLLTTTGIGEIKAKRSIVFLGSEISAHGIKPSGKQLRRLKRRISLIIYEHLLRALLRGKFNPKRIQKDSDWDLVTCVNAIRRVIYGRVTETELREGLIGLPEKAIKSSMSGLALVDDPTLLKGLDGWIVGCLERALSMRSILARRHKVKAKDHSRREIISGEWYRSTAFPQETRLPSCYLAWAYMKRHLKTSGIRALAAPEYEY